MGVDCEEEVYARIIQSKRAGVVEEGEVGE